MRFTTKLSRLRIPRRAFLNGLSAFPLLGLAASPVVVQSQPVATQEPNRHFAEVIGYKIEEHIRNAQFAILPLGSVEYHGPSGPASTDTVLAKGLADRLAPKFKATIFPCIEFTHNPAHTAAFRGSVSVRPEVLTMYFEDVLRGIYQNGCKKIFVLNGHSGNIAPMRAAISQVAGELKGSDILLANWWETLSIPLVESLNVFSPGSNGGRGHGGPLEMSSAAVFASNNVEAGRAPDLPPTPRPEDGTPYYHEKAATEDWPGYSGKLSEISRARGEKLVEAATKRLEALIEHWLKNEKKAGNW
ncbi:MAG: creatininase family protein [Acidobacteria bacterium]|nr:creatininase family protein [Acidobacteriota bacterium]MBI3427068.1 creatininase family protein [Acidobacteriota bacterium]